MNRVVTIKDSTTRRVAAARIVHKDHLDKTQTQAALVNQLYLGCALAEGPELIREIRAKIRGYRSQDKRKARSTDGFITYEQTLEKLVVSKLRCWYCKAAMLLLYSDRLDKRQWTLDRLNNSVGHSAANTVVACLGCNLQRRCIDDKKFLFTKQMRIIKKN